MAEAPATIDDKTAKLQVAAARQEESGQGIARLPKSTFSAMGITEGDVVEIAGKRNTAARAAARCSAFGVRPSDHAIHQPPSTSTGSATTASCHQRRPPPRQALARPRA